MLQEQCNVLLRLRLLSAFAKNSTFTSWDDLDLITSLDNYCDHVHYSPAVCQELAHRILQDQPMTQEEIAPRIAAFRAFLQSYDFDALFES